MIEIMYVKLGDGKNSERPLDTVELLRLIADTIEKQYDEQKVNTRPMQPFLVRHIDIRLDYGLGSIYFEPQGTVLPT